MKYGRISRALSFVAALLFSVSVSHGALAQKAPLVLKLAHAATTDQSIGKGMQKFAELVNAKTNGAVKVETRMPPFFKTLQDLSWVSPPIRSKTKSTSPTSSSNRRFS